MGSSQSPVLNPEGNSQPKTSKSSFFLAQRHDSGGLVDPAAIFWGVQRMVLQKEIEVSRRGLPRSFRSLQAQTILLMPVGSVG